MMNALKGIIISVVVFLLIWFIWEWGFCRFYVGPGQMAIIKTQSGKLIAEGQIVAKKGEMGLQEDVLGEGRHFLNPVMNDWKIVDTVTILPGQIGIVTYKAGTDMASTEDFMVGEGQKGIRKRVLGPGKYRLNPEIYAIDKLAALSIPVGYVGVVTSLSGKQAPENAFAGPGEKGVCGDILQPGIYYVNTKQYLVNVLEVGVNQVSLLGKEGGAVITKRQIETDNTAVSQLQTIALQQQQAKREDYFRQSAQQSAPEQRAERKAPKPAQRLMPQEAAVAQVLNQYVEFPSRDGFDIYLDMTVEFELLPERIAWLYRTYGDLPAVVDKIIMPQIMSVTRNKGSEYKAKDFVVGEGREKFQKDMTEALQKVLGEKKIIVHNALIRHVEVPAQILDPIQKAGIAGEQDLTNKERQNTARKLAELNRETSMIEQIREVVAQGTKKIRAEIGADQQKSVAAIHADALRQVAQIEMATAELRAAKTRIVGQATVESNRVVEVEKANGYQLKTDAFGDPFAFNLWELANSLNKDVKIRILHAGTGTLWTDMEKTAFGAMGGAKILMQDPGQPQRQTR